VEGQDAAAGMVKSVGLVFYGFDAIRYTVCLGVETERVQKKEKEKK
jgi:hypothetical protein